jgi:DNA helicase HerA-like ATPase
MDAEAIGIYGMRGSGKTTRAKQLIGDRKRLLIFDPHGEFPVHHVSSIKALKAAMAQNWSGFRLGYIPAKEQEIEELHKLSRFLFLAMQPYKDGREAQQMTLVVEELQESFPSEKLPRDLRGFETMCQRGRHWGINLIGITQQPASISTRFKGNCSEHHIFALDWHTDIMAIGQMIGPDNAKKIRGLKPHESYIYRQGELSFEKNTLK